MSAAEEIYGKVVRVLVEALNVDEHEITPAASPQGDLGAVPGVIMQERITDGDLPSRG